MTTKVYPCDRCEQQEWTHNLIYCKITDQTLCEDCRDRLETKIDLDDESTNT